MMRPFLRPALLLTLWLVAFKITVAPAAATPTNSEGVSAEKIIAQLDDADPDVRRVAALQLNSMGGSALEAIEAALKGDDLSPEARGRLEASLRFVRPRASRERARSAREKWRSDLFHNAYRDGGHTDPGFDADVHAAIDLYLDQGFYMLLAPPELNAKALAAFAKATRAGCADPMFLALGRLAEGRAEALAIRPGRPSNDVVMNACCQGNYPTAVKLHVWSVWCSWHYKHEDFVVLGDLLEAALKTADVPLSEVDGQMRLFASAFVARMVRPDLKSLMERYERLASKAPGPMMLRAEIAEAAAYTYRNKMLDAKTFDGNYIARYCQMLHEACAFANQAYERDPLDPGPPRFALRILNILGECEDTRDATELWFQRAIAADPDDRVPYEMKINNHLRRGRSAIDEVLAFGHECMRDQNWRGGIALTIVVAHEHVANFSGDRQLYFANASVWDDIKTAYEGSLINFPDDLARRCEFARYATLCGHWDVADSQFKIIGDNPVLGVFGSESSYKYLQGKAKKLAVQSSLARIGR